MSLPFSPNRQNRYGDDPYNVLAPLPSNYVMAPDYGPVQQPDLYQPFNVTTAGTGPVPAPPRPLPKWVVPVVLGLVVAYFTLSSGSSTTPSMAGYRRRRSRR